MKIFASLDDYIVPGGGVNIVGRNMANHFFFRALMRYGSFDEYHFFLSNRAHRNLFEQQHAAFLNEVGAARKIRLFDRIDLPEALKSHDYTVIHQSDHITHFASLARLRNELGARVPLSAFIHSLSYPSYMGRYLELHFSGLCESDTIICSSECGKTVVKNCLQNAVVKGGPVSPVTLEVIPLGIDEPPVVMDRSLARKQLGYKNDQVVGLCFGRFSDFDKMDLFPLLQALTSVEGSQYRLVLAGAVHDKEYFQVLQLWAKALGLLGRVDFVEQPSNEMKMALFSGADFFVSIADNPQETFGLTVLESMHAGTPLIVSDFDGYRELARDEAGIRVPTTWTEISGLTDVESLMDMRTLHRYLAQTLSVDMNALRNALRSMYTDAETRLKYGQQAQKRFAQHFTHSSIIARLEALWLSQKEQLQLSDAIVRSLRMNVFQSFSHYATAQLKDETGLIATAFARQLLEARADYPLLSSMSEIIDRTVVKEMTKFCFEEQTAGDVFRRFGDHWKIRLMLMWMLKHDLLETR